MSKVEELLAETKLSDLLHKNESAKHKEYVDLALAIIEQWQR